MERLFLLLLFMCTTQRVFAEQNFELGTKESSHMIDGGMLFAGERVTRNSTQFVDATDPMHTVLMQLQPIPENPNIMHWTVYDTRFAIQPRGWIDLSSEKHLPFTKRWYYHFWAEMPD